MAPLCIYTFHDPYPALIVTRIYTFWLGLIYFLVGSGLLFGWVWFTFWLGWARSGLLLACFYFGRGLITAGMVCFSFGRGLVYFWGGLI